MILKAPTSVFTVADTILHLANAHERRRKEEKCELAFLTSCRVFLWRGGRHARPATSPQPSVLDLVRERPRQTPTLPRPSCLQNRVARGCQAGPTHHGGVEGKGSEGYSQGEEERRKEIWVGVGKREKGRLEKGRRRGRGGKKKD